MDFKEIGKEYRPVPFWSWNEKLQVEESRRQVAAMDNVGIGGFFMHARGGLQTEYMSEEWFDNVTACVEEAEARGMHAWAYDENGWPSGFGNGLVNGRGERYWQKYLRMKKGSAQEIEPSRIIAQTDELCFYYEVNPFYVDTLDRDVTAIFLHEIYEPYYNRYGKRLDGFFTDEPQISRNGIPWSLILPDEYKKAYGEELLPHLPELFMPLGDYRRTRVRFWKLVTELFSRNFMKQIHDWCADHGLKFTGHLVLEENLHCQLTSNGACMPHYEYFDIPGMDWLCRPIFSCLTMLQLTSAAVQLGKRQILSETFALCGHNVGHDALKRNYEWMMVRGVNLLCQHLQGYSLRGIRKRDYPPAMYEQQPWWSEYRVFNDAMSRIGMMLAKGEITAHTLVIHPQTSAWICYDDGACEGIGYYNEQLLAIMNDLERKHVQYHLGDEILMERHGRVENGRLIIGQMSYDRVILPPHLVFLEHTEQLLAQFRAQGGRIVTADEVESDDIVDNPNITYTRRDYPEEGFVMHYFVNSADEEQDATFACGGQIMDIESGALLPFDGTYRFPKWGSLVIIDDGTPCVPVLAVAKKPILELSGAWSVVSTPENAWTLDRCTYYFDGELQEENSYILNVANRALAKERPVDILCRYTVQAEYVPTTLHLACETPELFDICVNGMRVNTSEIKGFFRDRSFCKLDISGLFRKGENTIETRIRFEQSTRVYENLKKARVFESEKNKLTYDKEIEAMYLVGDFGIRCDGSWEEVDHRAAFFDGAFVMVEPPKTVTLTHLERQGYPFYAGEWTLERTIDVPDGDIERILRFDKAGINALRVAVNDIPVKTLLWAPYEVDLTPYLRVGENRVRLTLVNNLRNLLGPHHHPDGELLGVAPPHFYGDPCIWNNYGQSPYTDRYCFVETSLIET